MLYSINPKPPEAGAFGPIASLLAPLSLAARDDEPLEKPLLDIVRSLGFEGFTYGMSTAKTMHADTRFYHWTTSPRQWVVEYDRWISGDPSSSLVARGVAPQQQAAPISRRGQQCLIPAAKGQTSADSADKLDLSERTVNVHFGNIFSKLAVANRGEAIAVAMTRGIISRWSCSRGPRRGELP
jgi:DNA-binding CsgD family transcriptional regulator